MKSSRYRDSSLRLYRGTAVAYKHNPRINWRKNRLMIAKIGRRYDLDARKDPCVGKGKHVKLLSAKQLCRMVKGKSKTILVTLQAIEKNSAPRN
jgi:hypothetical protein